MNNHGNFKKTSKDRVENDKKKRRFRNLKNLLKALQQFLSFPTCPGCYEPPNKMQP